MKTKHIAIYVRVSSKGQKTDSQVKDLKQWREQQDPSIKIKVYTDKMTGKTMDRPAWNRLQKAIDSKQVKTLCVWRLDRLGRTASGLTKLFDQLTKDKVNLVSIKDGIDLSTTAGRLIANVLSSVAQYENEVRTERVRAGQAIAKEKGISWGGSKKGRLCKVTQRQATAVIGMVDTGEKKTHIAEVTGLSRPTIDRLIKRHAEGALQLS